MMKALHRRVGCTLLSLSVGLCHPTLLHAAEGGSAWSGLLRAIGGVFTGSESSRGAASVAENAPVTPVGTHRQTRLIEVKGKGGLRLVSFCVSDAGTLVTLLSTAADPHVAAAAPTSGEQADVPSEIRILDLTGAVLKSIPVDFQATTVNVSPNGSFVVGGSGLVAKYSADGQQLLRCDAPQIANKSKDREAYVTAAKAMLKQQAESYKQILETYEQEEKKWADQPDDTLSESDKEQKANAKQLADMYRQIAEQQSPDSEAAVEQLVQYLQGQENKINAISANGQYIFVTCGSSQGYGYDVWRTDQQFENAKCIVTGLSGCCGQMDVQCCGENLFVAENARHRVVQYSAEGEQLLSFGKRGRDAEGECFGGCCNPMNTRLVGDKLYVAESDGTVKRFSCQGEFDTVLGRANVQPGCKSSIVGATADGKTIFYFDVMNSAICVLESQPTDVQAALP